MQDRNRAHLKRLRERPRSRFRPPWARRRFRRSWSAAPSPGSCASISR
jgi:hypothetical protein